LRNLNDFGDNWQHDVVVEAVGRADSDACCPRCTTGRRLLAHRHAVRLPSHRALGVGAPSMRLTPAPPGTLTRRSELLSSPRSLIRTSA
jgi:hypothetical protein